MNIEYARFFCCICGYDGHDRKWTYFDGTLICWDCSKKYVRFPNYVTNKNKDDTYNVIKKHADNEKEKEEQQQEQKDNALDGLDTLFGK